MTRFQTTFLFAASALTLAACASPSPADYANEKPVLDLKAYFNGNLTAHGIFTDRSGKVVRRFTVEMACSWQGDDGVLDERFVYSDGETQQRIWRLKKLPDGRYTGTADDVVGTAQGQAAGNAFRWAYTLRLPVDNFNLPSGASCGVEQTGSPRLFTTSHAKCLSALAQTRLDSA